MYGSKAFKPEFIVEWARQHGVLEAIFGSKTYHIELIKRSNELIRLLTAEEKITKDELELFWSASKYDDHVKKEIYKVITDIVAPLKGEQI